jgi:2,4-dienoyl-CoA reductase-like NADH-dependent reductase (Old Yellow Enzyme family)
VRELWPPHWPVFVRISATDWKEGGWDLSQSIELSKALAAIGIDLIDCSSGGMAHDAKIPSEPGYQVPFAEAIRREAKIATGAVDLITGASQRKTLSPVERPMQCCWPGKCCETRTGLSARRRNWV